MMTRRERLTDWVKTAHQGQLIKKTAKPYFEHVWAVAEMAEPFAAFSFEAGLCHDLLEKTTIGVTTLHETLVSFSYTATEADIITEQVTELTNVFTKHSYPELSKRERKDKEDKRLLTISADAQTVKYCDLLYNIEWMLKYNREKAAAYMKRKLALITAMDKGDSTLRLKAIKKIKDDAVDPINL